MEIGMENAMERRGAALATAAIVAVAFGLVTLKEGGGVLFGDEAARRAAGHYVPFVLWFNFLAGFAYIAAGAALWLRRRWGAALAFAIAASTIAVYAAFGVHVMMGGAFERRTVFALALRTVLWIAISAVAWRSRPRLI
jgi:hypothetical protein